MTIRGIVGPVATVAIVLTLLAVLVLAVEDNSRRHCQGLLSEARTHADTMLVYSTKVGSKVVTCYESLQP